MTEFESFVFNRLSDINRTDMTQSEQQIAQRLVDNEHAGWFNITEDNDHPMYRLVRAQ